MGDYYNIIQEKEERSQISNHNKIIIIKKNRFPGPLKFSLKIISKLKKSREISLKKQGFFNFLNSPGDINFF